MFDREGHEHGLRTVGVFIALAAVLLAVTGAVLLVGFTTDLLGVPVVTGGSHEFVGANESVSVVESNVTVRNPNPVMISVDDVDVHHTVYMNSVLMGRGERQRLDLPRGSSTVTVRTALLNERIDDWWVSHLRRGERTNLTVVTRVTSSTLDRSYSRTIASRTMETDIISAFKTDRTVPVNASVPLISNPVLYVNETNAHWEHVEDDRTVVLANLTVYNPKSVPVPVDNVSYGVAMNGIVVGNGSTRSLSTIPPKSSANVTARLVIDNGKLGEWWPTHVRRNQTTRVTFDYAVKLDLVSGSATVSPPPINQTFETDVFGPNGTGLTPSVRQSPRASSNRLTRSALPT